MTTLLLVLWQVVPFGNAQWDKKGRKPNYVQMFIIRAMALVIYLFFWTKDPKDGWLVFWVSVYAITSFYLVFEILLNVWRDRPLLHYDYVELDSGRIDRGFAWLYRKFKTHLFHHLAKVLCLIIAILAITKIYELHIVR